MLASVLDTKAYACNHMQLQWRLWVFYLLSPSSFPNGGRTGFSLGTSLFPFSPVSLGESTPSPALGGFYIVQAKKHVVVSLSL